MKKALCYKKDDLLALLPGFQLLKIKTIHEDEDDYNERQEYHISNRPDIKEIYHYHSLFTTTTVKYQDGTTKHLYGKNVYCEGNMLRSIDENHFLSPRVSVSAEHISAESDLIVWLKFNGVTEEALEQITDSYTLYHMIEYPGVSNPVKSTISRGWGYSSELLVLDEREIETVLTSIEDELLRKKIECILHANVFKKHY